MYLCGYFLSERISFDSLTIPKADTSTFADLFIGKLDISTVATNDNDSKTQQIKLYPNPTNHELTIELEGDKLQDIEITMYNTLGEAVYRSPKQINVQKKIIDIDMLSPGIYFLELNIDGKRIVEKVVKE